MKEIWKPISGYEGYYEVSNLGRVKSCEREIIRKNGTKFTVKEKILKHHYKKDGYLIISLCKNSKQKTYTLHRLVATAFLSNPFGKPCINHIDANKKNNCVDNLEWCTIKENSQHSIHLALRTPSKHRKGKLTQEQVNEIRRLYKRLDREYNTYILARKYGVSQTAISKIIHNHTYKE